MIEKSLQKVLWARIAAATVIHGFLSAIVFEACSFSASSLAMDPASFTLLRLGKTLFVVLSQCSPIFTRVIIGQTMDSRRWGLLRVDSAPRTGFQARIYLAQFLSSSLAAAVFAINLIRAVDMNASYRVGVNNPVVEEDEENESSQIRVVSTSTLYSWWHIEFILLSALAAVVADTVRSIRLSEHDLVFPMLRNHPELLSPLLHTHLPRLIIQSSLSALQWIIFAFCTAHFFFPVLSKVALYLAQFSFGHLLNIPVVPAAWSLLDDIASRHWLLFTPPFAIVWRAFVTYAANYLLLKHGVETLKRLLSTPIDFNRIAGYQPGDGPGYSQRERSGSDFVGGAIETVFIDADGRPASSLLMRTMSIGWQEALQPKPLVSGNEGMDESKPQWLMELDQQRDKMDCIRGRLLSKELTLMRSGGKGFVAACDRLWKDLLSCGEMGVKRGAPVPLKIPCWNEQDGNSLLDHVARALALQSASESMMTGGRMRSDIYRNYWSQFASVCCLNIDNFTMQLQTFVADKQRKLVVSNEGEGGVACLSVNDLGDLFHEGQSANTEWAACALIDQLAAQKRSLRKSKYDRIAARIVLGILKFVPNVVQKASVLLKCPLPLRLPAPATQMMLWSIEALSRGLSFASADEFGDARSSLPVALYSLIGLQLSLEAVSMEFKLNRLQGRGGHQQILPEFESISIVVDTSISLIVRTTKHALPAFSFPPKYAARLRHYVALNS